MMQLDAARTYSEAEVEVIAQQTKFLFPTMRFEATDAKFYIDLVQSFYKDSRVNLMDIPVVLYAHGSTLEDPDTIKSGKSMLKVLLKHNLRGYYATDAGRKALIMLIDSVEGKRVHNAGGWLTTKGMTYALDRIKWLAGYSFEYNVQDGCVSYAEAHFKTYCS